MSRHHDPVELLRDYAPRALAAETQHVQALTTAVQRDAGAINWNSAAAHAVASAWTVSLDRRQVLMVLHKKFGCWMHAYAHAGGDGDLASVALRAATEARLSSARLVSDELFDFDQYFAPASRYGPEHWHFDFRFCVEADPGETVHPPANSYVARWFPLREVPDLNSYFGIPRMVAKTAQFARARPGRGLVAK